MRSIDEGQARFWDIFLKVIAGLAAAVAWTWSIGQYRDVQREQQVTLRTQVQAQQLQTQQPFLIKQLEIYLHISEAASRSATSKTKKEKEKALYEFEVLVDGPLKLVSAGDVDKATWEFYDCLRNSHCPKGDAVRYAKEVARACRTSTAEFWKITLPKLP